MRGVCRLERVVCWMNVQYNMISKLTPNEDGSYNVTTVAGTGSMGSKNGAGDQATLNNPSGVSVASDGSVFVADYVSAHTGAVGLKCALDQHLCACALCVCVCSVLELPFHDQPLCMRCGCQPLAHPRPLSGGSAWGGSTQVRD